MADAQTLARRAAVAAGREPADLVLKNAGVVNVFTKEITVCDVAVADGYIAGLGEYSGRTEADCTGKIEMCIRDRPTSAAERKVR